GIYTDLATASTHIIEKSISYKSCLTKEAAEKALEESYKTIATEETQKSKQFVYLNQHLQSQTTKLNAFNRMKNIPTAKEKEEMRRPTVEKFQRLLDSLMNYNEVHATMLFYPKKRRNIRPKAVFMPEASAKDIYDYYVHGLLDTIYIKGETLKELQEFPLKVQGIIKGHKEVFAKVRELFLKIRSSYPIFDKEQKLLVPSITVAQLGVNNKGYPKKDEKIECAPPTIKDLVYSFMEVLARSSKIGIGPRQKDKIKINYCSKNLLIYSKLQERIDEV
nr:enzymatic polyprotein [Tanacetum cinerariifolium]